MREIHALIASVLIVGCAAADDDTASLRRFLEARESAPAADFQLNLALARDAVRVSGYERAGVSAPEHDSWSPIVVAGDDGEHALYIERWLESGDVDDDGVFAPCIARACTLPLLSDQDRELVRAWAGDECVDDRASRVAAAALRLRDGLDRIEWTEPSTRAIVVRPDEGLVQINPRLIALIECSAPPADERVVEQRSAAPAAAPAATTAPPVEPLSHEPPPGTEESHGDSGCDCDDDFDCNNDKSSSNNEGGSSCALGSSRPRPVPVLFWLVALALSWRRAARRRRRPKHVLPLCVLVTIALPGVARAQETPAAAPAQAAASAELVVNGFAPDASIAIDGTPVGTGSYRGSVAPGRHLVQVYKPGGPAYDFYVDAVAGQTATVPPPAPQYAPAPYGVPPPAPPDTAPPKPKKRFKVGPYLLAQLGFVVPTAAPNDFDYELRRDEDTGEMREGSGIGYMIAAVGGYRVSSWFGAGGLLAYASAGGDGTVTQTELSSTGALLDHTGPAELRIQSLRLGPQARFLAGGDRARFLGALALGIHHTWVDLEHVHVVEQGGTLIESGTFHHDYSGWGQFTSFELGAEFNVGDHLLLGVALDVFVDGTSRIEGDPFDDTALGYVGMSLRVGWHDWKPE